MTKIKTILKYLNIVCAATITVKLLSGLHGHGWMPLKGAYGHFLFTLVARGLELIKKNEIKFMNWGSRLKKQLSAINCKL